ncbi:hypothetical protein EDC96DRAFT_497097 [Choanephora cucurbitarum]|nr:hypothetical protein EDC96DRAFT_497097 [Choanephora cucurbitarum]
MFGLTLSRSNFVRIPVRLFTTKPTSERWLPKKRVSRPTMDKIRLLAALQPSIYNPVRISQEFKLSVEAVKRILKSKYLPTQKDAERQEKNRFEAMRHRREQFKTNKPQGKE